MPALAATRVFTGTEMLPLSTLTIEGGRIVDIQAGVSPGATLLEGLLAPGLVDVQVNGGGGVLFNDAPTAQTLRTMTDAHAQFGVTGIMATLISDEPGKVEAAVEAVEEAFRSGLRGLLGLHLEGPWLAPARRGVHPEHFLRALERSDLALLTRKRPFAMLMTVAPEQVSPDEVRALVDAGVTVSIGHTAADQADVAALLDAGATGFTHLFNAMPPLEGRKPSAVGVALADTRAWAGLILDGIHVHPVSVRAAFAAKTSRKLMLVSDAMATVGSQDPSMTLFGETIVASGGALRTTTGTLAGAHMDLATAVRNAVGMIGASVEEALQMASLTPAEFLKLDHQRGRIAPGALADLVLFGPDLDVRNVWRAGDQTS